MEITMKRILFVLFVFLSVSNINASVKHVYLKLGEIWWKSAAWGGGGEENSNMTGSAVAVEFIKGGTVNIYGIAPGVATFQNYWNYGDTYVFHVLDVIPDNVAMTVGGSYTYSPVALMDGSYDSIKDFTWASSNESVAKVDANGHVTAVGPGKAVISAKANYTTTYMGSGYTAKSVVTVSNQPAQELKLNKKSQELEVGKSARLTATISPDNTTNKTVKWLSSNENIAQVDDNGNVTAIGAGYCSIYAKADDGSGKFAKCLIHVTGTAGSRSDVNGDGVVTVTDAEVVIEEILSQQ